MIRAISVERRPRILPSASMMNHFGSMSPCLGKYVRMTLPEYTSQLRFDLRRTAAQGNCSAPRVIQRQPHTFPTEGGETVTLPNRGRQGVHSRGAENAAPGFFQGSIERDTIKIRARENY